MKNMKKILAGLTLGVMVMGATALSIKSAEAFGGMHGYGGRGGYHTNYSEMTDAQKAEVKARYEQRMEWHKKDLQADVAAGKITQKEADARITLMQERFQAMQDGKLTGFYGSRYADMTDAQKAEFNARHEQRMEWHKKDLQLAVDAGKITQKEADERIARMQSRYKDMQDGKMGMRHNYKEGRHNYKGDRNGHGYYRDGHGGSTDCPRY